MKYLFFLISLVVIQAVQAGEVTSGRRVQDYEVNEAAIKAGPLKNMSTQNLCDGDQSFTVYADRDLISQGGKALQTCEMYLNPYFAQLFKNFIPMCAKKAAVKNGLSAPTHVSVEQLGGYVDRNARNSSSLSRHALGMAVDLSSVQLHYRDFFGRESTKRIDLTDKTTNQPFYDSFRDCWDAAVAAENKASGKSCTCSIGHPHTHKPSNALHSGHMHISLVCPPGSGVATCSNDRELQSVAKHN